MSFFKSVVLPRLTETSVKVLDLGCGSKSIFEDTELDPFSIDAFDFSSEAIRSASGHSAINYQQVDIAQANALPVSTYDLIFDSHCLHCITDQASRKESLKNIHHALKDEGLFCAEMMVASSEDVVNLPHKYVVSSRELEDELLKSGFKIIYFMIVRDLVFSNDNGECELLRVICRK